MPMASSSSQPFDPTTMVGIAEASQGTMAGDAFDLFDWYSSYQDCQRYFLDHAQHSGPVQSLSAFLNIRLPFQRYPDPVLNSSSASQISPSSSSSAAAAAGQQQQQQQQPLSSSSPSTSSAPPSVSLIPYIRRLVATGMDFPGVLQGFFGENWGSGIGTLHEQERRNYLFAAKSGGWASVKKDYDIPPLETIPFLRPLQGSLDSEIEAAERSWSEWLAMEDWMVGPRAPDLDSSSQASHPRSARG